MNYNHAPSPIYYATKILKISYNHDCNLLPMRLVEVMHLCILTNVFLNEQFKFSWLNLMDTNLSIINNDSFNNIKESVSVQTNSINSSFFPNQQKIIKF